MTIKSLFIKIPRRTRIFVVFLLVIVAAYFVSRFLFLSPRNIPKDFLTAREQASLIANGIVSSSNDSLRSLDEIEKLDQEGKYTEALTLVTQEFERTRELRGKAVDLSAQLEQMANSVSGIRPASASQSAIQAITAETTLIGRLIAYNDYLTQLLEVLQGKFLNQNVDYHNKIPELIGKMNDETKAINDLNAKFNEMMKDFDGNF